MPDDPYTATTTGYWDEPATWGGSVPNIDNPYDLVTIPEGITVTILVDKVVDASNGPLEFDVRNATIINHGVLLIRGELFLDFVTLENTGTIEVRSTIDGDGLLDTAWSEIKNSGTFITSGDVELFATEFSKVGKDGLTQAEADILLAVASAL